jgi:hypothetical protein
VSRFTNFISSSDEREAHETALRSIREHAPLLVIIYDAFEKGTPVANAYFVNGTGKRSDPTPFDSAVFTAITKHRVRLALEGHHLQIHEEDTNETTRYAVLGNGVSFAVSSIQGTGLRLIHNGIEFRIRKSVPGLVHPSNPNQLTFHFDTPELQPEYYYLIWVVDDDHTFRYCELVAAQKGVNGEECFLWSHEVPHSADLITMMSECTENLAEDLPLQQLTYEEQEA